MNEQTTLDSGAAFSADQFADGIFHSDDSEFGWYPDIWIRTATMLAACSNSWTRARAKLRDMRALSTHSQGDHGDDIPHPDANTGRAADSNES